MKKFNLIQGLFGLIGLIVGTVYGYLIEDYIITWAIVGLMAGAAGYAILN